MGAIGHSHILMIWVCSMIFFTSSNVVVRGLGVNWGRNTTNQLVVSAVVNLIMNAGFDQVKLFDAEEHVVSAFANTGIELMIGIPNDQLYRFANSSDNARLWVKKNVTEHINNHVDIKYVAVGNKPFLKYRNDTYYKHIFPALENIQKALNEYHPGNKIKATVPFGEDLCESKTKHPSGGEFREDIKDIMLPILKFLDTNNSPFVITISPFNFHLENPETTQNFSTFHGNGIDYSITDNNIIYTSSFDLLYDTVVTALTKAGFPRMRVTVGEVGWPSDNYDGYSEHFFNMFMQKYAKGTGTPLRPGPFDYYLYSLIDENKLSTRRSPLDRHWGLYEYDGKPKCRIDFTGRGNLKYGPQITSQQYMPTRWCVLNREKMNTERALVEETFKTTCRDVDCSSLEYGLSCNQVLDYYGNVSYAFNMAYQTYATKEPDMCTPENTEGRLRGLGVISTDDPLHKPWFSSTHEKLYPCKLIVQIISGSERLYNVFTTIIVVALLSLSSLYVIEGS